MTWERYLFASVGVVATLIALTGVLVFVAAHDWGSVALLLVAGVLAAAGTYILGAPRGK